MMKEDRVRFPRIRAPQKNYVGLLNRLVRTRAAARSEYRRQTGDAGGMSSSVAAVDVVRSDHRANELLRNEVQFVGGFRTTEHPERVRAMLLDLFPETPGYPVERLIPCSGTMRPVRAD
jgi:hypothetical protein